MKKKAAFLALTAAGLALTLATGASHARGPADIITDPSEIGLKLPGTMAKSIGEERILDTTNGQGLQIIVARTTRAPGTRTPLHLHEYAGTTCVLEGEMTLYLEGAEPSRAVAGQCYYMPAGKAMAGVNTGTVNAVMLDHFTVPVGKPVWTVVELAGRTMQDQFDTQHKH
jgi:quercetin dioxygenase-like cupin family protein